jgi:molecular chaperone GrpE
MPQEEELSRQPAPPAAAQVQEPKPGPEEIDSDKPMQTGVDWEAIAKRLQADMDNFRKRQRRQAEEAAQTERERMLRLILPVADNLTRALSQQQSPDEGLRLGIELTQRELNRLLEAEGVTRIETVGHSFDPDWHEALAALPTPGVAPNTIIEEVEAGYRLADKLLRPARVVVAA